MPAAIAFSATEALSWDDEDNQRGMLIRRKCSGGSRLCIQRHDRRNSSGEPNSAVDSARMVSDSGY